MHVLGNWLLAPGMELAGCCGNHIQATAAAGYFEQVDCPVEHGCCLLDVTLTDVHEGQVPEDDRLRLVTPVEATRGVLEDRPRLGAVAEGEIAGALYPSEAVGGEEALGGISSLHCLKMRLSGTKDSLTFPTVTQHRVALADMQERKALQGMTPNRSG